MKKTAGLLFVLFCVLMLGGACKAKDSTSSNSGDKQVQVKAKEAKLVSVFGNYPADYEIAYFNMMGYSKALTVRNLFGADAPLKTEGTEASPWIAEIESISGNKNELTVTVLISTENPAGGEAVKLMRVQFKFQADSTAEKSYARYYKITNLVTGTTSEVRSNGSTGDDGEVLGALIEILEMGWNASIWQ